VSAPDQLPGGRHELRFEFKPTGQPDFGRGKGSPVTTDYRAPFRFTGALHSVTVDLSGDLITDSASKRRMAMTRQ
jgi:hypothetical protein